MDALERILSWSNGTAQEVPFQPGIEATINQPWQAILMQVAQAIDELQ